MPLSANENAVLVEAPRPAAWYYNIKANPALTLLGRGFRGSFLAEEVVGPECDRLFHFAAGASSPYDHYQQSAAARPIAVIAFRLIGRLQHAVASPDRRVPRTIAAHTARPDRPRSRLVPPASWWTSRGS